MIFFIQINVKEIDIYVFAYLEEEWIVPYWNLYLSELKVVLCFTYAWPKLVPVSLLGRHKWSASPFWRVAPQACYNISQTKMRTRCIVDWATLINVSLSMRKNKNGRPFEISYRHPYFIDIRIYSLLLPTKVSNSWTETIFEKYFLPLKQVHSP